MPASVVIPEGSSSASFPVTTLTTAGVATITASAAGFSPDTTQVTVTAPGITLTPASVSLQTLETGNFNVSIPSPAGPGGQLVNLTSSDVAVATVPASVVIPEGAGGTTFNVTTQGNAGTATIGASAAGFDSASSQVNVSARGMSYNLLSPFVGVGRSSSGSIVLDQPAPSGGVTISLSTGNTAIATVDQASVFIPQGDTSAGFTFNGLTIGSTPLTASANGYTDEVVNIVVTSSNVINFGLIPDLAPGQSVSLPISLGQPAPAGGLTISFSSSDPAIATVTPTVFIPEGQQVPAGNPQITGILLGSVQITGVAPGYAPDSRTATITLNTSFSPSSLNVAETGSNNITLQLSAPAPAGGVTFNLTTDDTGIATVPSSASIPAGQLSTQIIVSGIAVGSTTLRANSAGLSETTAGITVVPLPAIFMGDVTVGEDLQRGVFISLGATPSSPVDVTVTVANDSVASLSSSTTTAGTSSVTFSGVTSTSVGTVYVQGLSEGTTQLTVQAANYNDDTSSVTVDPSGFYLNRSDFTTNVFAGNTTVQLRTYRLSPTTLALAAEEPLRAGLTVDVDLTNSDDTVGVLTVDPVTFTSGVSRVNSAFDPSTAGSTTVTLVQPAGFQVPSNASNVFTATVEAPDIFMSDVTVGKDLQRGVFISLESAPPSPVDVTVTVANDSVASLSSSTTTAGTSSVTFSGVTSTSVGTVYVQGLSEGTTQLTVQAANYNDDTSSVTVDPSGFYLNRSDFTTNVFAGNTTVQLRTYRLSPTTLALAAEEPLRAGLTVDVDLTNSDDTVGVLTVDPVTFTSGVSRVNSAFDPSTAGSTTVTLVQPAGFQVPSNASNVFTATVEAPDIFMSDVTVGKDLQRGVFISLEAAPPNPVDVTVTIAAPSVALLSTNATSTGTSSVTFSGVTSTSVGTVYVQGLSTGSTQLTVQAAGYNDDINIVTVDPSGFITTRTDFTTDVFAADTTVQLRTYRLNPTTLALVAEEPLRAGLTVDVDLTNSDDSVGVMTIDPVTFTGGVSRVNSAFDPLSGGSTTIAIVQPPGFQAPFAANTSFTVTVTGTIPAGQVNLTQTVTTTATASTIFNSAYPASKAIDGVSGSGSSWCTANNDPAPSLTIDFGEDTTVSSLLIVEYAAGSSTYDFLTGRFRLFDAALAQIYDAGVVALNGGNIDLDVTPDVGAVRRVVFEGVTWNSIEPCLSEFAVIGTAP